MIQRDERPKESAGKKTISLVIGSVVAGVIAGGLAVLAGAYLLRPHAGLDPAGMGDTGGESKAGAIFTLIFIAGAVAGVVGWIKLWFEANSD